MFLRDIWGQLLVIVSSEFHSTGRIYVVVLPPLNKQLCFYGQVHQIKIAAH